MLTKFNFTKDALSSLPIPASEQRKVYHDAKTTGLQLRVTSTGIKTFSVFRRVPASFQSAFAARGRTEFGDCGASLGLAYAIVELGFLVPWIGLIPWVAAWVMLILLLVRFHDYKEKLIQAQEAPLQNPNL